MGICNAAYIDTTPGSNPECPFCPPAGFIGSPQDYLALCQNRYANDRLFGQRIRFAANFAAKKRDDVLARPTIVGPFADQVWELLDRVSGIQSAVS